MAKLDYAFQTDSAIISESYRQNDNYLVEYSERNSGSGIKTCALYFSSNDIYFPNSEEVFKDQIIKKNRYEWYNTRLKKADKHIFIRDIKKQWYLHGISEKHDSIEKLFELLKLETEGYKIITVGSSAGGYAAVLLGSLLNCEYALSFNGQFFLEDLLITSTPELQPIVFREKNNTKINQYYSIKKFLKEQLKIFYFYSNRSDWDVTQYNHISDSSINCIPFSTSHHGIPFLKSNLNIVLNSSEEWLLRLVGKVQNPLLFSVKSEGIINTILSIYVQLKKKLKKDKKIKKAH